MKVQLTFSDMERAERKRPGRRETFLRKMDALIPWAELVAVIQPRYYPGKRGRPPVGIETMLRMYFLQLWYSLSDEMTEESIYDSRAMKEFMGIDFHDADVPDATTPLNFRHLPERNGLQKKLFEAINAALEREGMIWRGGSVVDATIIEAATSTKNSSKSRDPEMHQTKKGNQWRHGMKAHVGADAGTGMARSLTFTAANVADVTEASKLVREDDGFVVMDAGYAGVEKREEASGDERLSAVDWRVSPRMGARRALESELCKDALGRLGWAAQPRWDAWIARLNAKVRAKVEHSFHIVKNLFGYRKARCRGLEKNGARLYMLFGLANAYRWLWRKESLGTRPASA